MIRLTAIAIACTALAAATPAAAQSSYWTGFSRGYNDGSAPVSNLNEYGRGRLDGADARNWDDEDDDDAMMAASVAPLYPVKPPSYLEAPSYMQAPSYYGQAASDDGED